MPISDKKLVLAGNTLHYYHYNYPQSYALKKPKITTRTHFRTPEGETAYSPATEDQSNAWRSKKTIKFIVQANANQWKNPQGRNYKAIFVTLTFKDDIDTLEQANPIFKLFIQRLNYFVYKKKCAKLQYLVVPEFQKKTRQAVHYHIIFFNLQFIDKIYDEFNRIWGKGNVNVKTVNNTIHLSNYIVKYITKQTKDIRTFNKKSYFTSRGLYRPITLRKQEIIETILKHYQTKINYQKQFHSGSLLTSYQCLTIETKQSIILQQFLQLCQRSLHLSPLLYQQRMQLVFS